MCSQKQKLVIEKLTYQILLPFFLLLGEISTRKYRGKYRGKSLKPYIRDKIIGSIGPQQNSHNNFILNCFLSQALKGMAATFRVTSSHIVKTSAEHRLPSTDSVLTMLKWVERHFMRRKPRANSLTYRTKKKDGVTMQMSFDLVPSSLLTTNSGPDDDVV